MSPHVSSEKKEIYSTKSLTFILIFFVTKTTGNGWKIITKNNR